jgi:hypothetical protein
VAGKDVTWRHAAIVGRAYAQHMRCALAVGRSTFARGATRGRRYGSRPPKSVRKFFHRDHLRWRTDLRGRRNDLSLAASVVLRSGNAGGPHTSLTRRTRSMMACATMAAGGKGRGKDARCRAEQLRGAAQAVPNGGQLTQEEPRSELGSACAVCRIWSAACGAIHTPMPGAAGAARCHWGMQSARGCWLRQIGPVRSGAKQLQPALCPPGRLCSCSPISKGFEITRFPNGVPRVYSPPERNTGPRGWPMVMRSAVSVLPWSESVPSAMMKTPAFTAEALVDEPSVLR